MSFLYIARMNYMVIAPCVNLSRYFNKPSNACRNKIKYFSCILNKISSDVILIPYLFICICLVISAYGI